MLNFSALTRNGHISGSATALIHKRVSKERISVEDLRQLRKKLLPTTADLHARARAPIIHMGYQLFEIINQTYFAGAPLPFAPLQPTVKDFVLEFRNIEYLRIRPIIDLTTLNENWAYLSVSIQNRTASWGSCCHEDTVRQGVFYFRAKTLI